MAFDILIKTWVGCKMNHGLSITAECKISSLFKLLMPHKTTKYIYTHTHTQNNKIYTFFSSDELFRFSDKILLSLPHPFVSHGSLCHCKDGDPKRLGKPGVGKCETTQNGIFFYSDELLPFSDKLLPAIC